MRYLVCNTNTHGNTDYDKPITVHKSTDYRTSYKTNLRYIAPFAQDFDARVQVPIKQVKNPIFKEDFYVTDNHRNYKSKKSVKNPLDLSAPEHVGNVQYLRTFGERLFRNPPAPIATPKTEIEEQYTRKFPTELNCTVYPPNPHSVCGITAFGRDEQPPLRPEESGYHKHLDIYLSTTRADYVGYSQRAQDGIGRKDIITYYDASGIPRGGKGYGPKVVTNFEPLVPRREKPTLFKKKENKMQKRSNVTEPFVGKSEYNDNYVKQSYSAFFPYLFENGEQFKYTNPGATPWQTLASPGMYDTEYCHLGTGWPVRSVVELKKPKKEYVHYIPAFCDCK